ncbi:MAG: DUF5675 family protein [Janthinobacterium lividum]
MQLLLTRLVYTPDATLGTLTVGGAPLCQVLEGPVRTPQHPRLARSPGVPLGTYTVVLTYSTRLRQPVPLLLHVRGHEDVRIRAGACVPGSPDLLVGTYAPHHPHGLANGPIVYARLLAFLQAAREAGQPVFLTIA